MSEYVVTLPAGLEISEVDNLIWQTIQKATISIRQGAARLLCSVPAGPSRFIVPGVQRRLPQHGLDLHMGKVIKDESHRTDFEVILGMSPPNWTPAQNAVFQSLNVSPDVQNASRFDKIGEQCSVKRADGKPFSHAQLIRLKSIGLDLQAVTPPTPNPASPPQIQPDLPVADSVHNAPKTDDDAKASETPDTSRIKFKEFL